MLRLYRSEPISAAFFSAAVALHELGHNIIMFTVPTKVAKRLSTQSYTTRKNSRIQTPSGDAPALLTPDNTADGNEL